MEKLEDEVGMILVSQKTWDRIKGQFPPEEAAFPNVGFMNTIPIRISELVGDDMIVPLPNKIVNMGQDVKFHKTEFKVVQEPLWKQMLRLYWR